MVGMDEVEKMARPMWAAAQRIGIQIAAMPRDEREAAFKACEDTLRETVSGSGMSAAHIEGLVRLQVEAIRGMVQNIDVGGSPEGGRA